MYTMTKRHDFQGKGQLYLNVILDKVKTTIRNKKQYIINGEEEKAINISQKLYVGNE